MDLPSLMQACYKRLYEISYPRFIWEQSNYGSTSSSITPKMPSGNYMYRLQFAHKAYLWVRIILRVNSD
jgi:hypothetical protein